MVVLNFGFESFSLRSINDDKRNSEIKLTTWNVMICKKGFTLGRRSDYCHRKYSVTVKGRLGTGFFSQVTHNRKVVLN